MEFMEGSNVPKNTRWSFFPFPSFWLHATFVMVTGDATPVSSNNF